MAKTHRGGARRAHRDGGDVPFRCGHCKMMVGALPSGGRNRNHCPYCLYSRHVDTNTPGDRAATCGSSMRPIGRFARRNGEDVPVIVGNDFRAGAFGVWGQPVGAPAAATSSGRVHARPSLPVNRFDRIVEVWYEYPRPA